MFEFVYFLFIATVFAVRRNYFHKNIYSFLGFNIFNFSSYNTDEEYLLFFLKKYHQTIYYSRKYLIYLHRSEHPLSYCMPVITLSWCQIYWMSPDCRLSCPGLLKSRIRWKQGTCSTDKQNFPSALMIREQHALIFLSTNMNTGVSTIWRTFIGLSVVLCPCRLVLQETVLENLWHTAVYHRTHENLLHLWTCFEATMTNCIWTTPMSKF